MTYKIIRKHFNKKFDDVIVAEGLSLKEAQKHCKNKETSSRTCQSEEMIEYTEKHGPWFDAYDEE